MTNKTRRHLSAVSAETIEYFVIATFKTKGRLRTFNQVMQLDPKATTMQRYRAATSAIPGFTKGTDPMFFSAEPNQLGEVSEPKEFLVLFTYESRCGGIAWGNIPFFTGNAGDQKSVPGGLESYHAPDGQMTRELLHQTACSITGVHSEPILFFSIVSS